MGVRADSSGTRLFLKQAREDFLRIGAIAPSSRFLARAVTSLLADHGAPLRVLEAGAGTGALTSEILRRMPAGSTLDIYEINPTFARHLAERFGSHRNVAVWNKAVEEVSAQPSYDAIISGLPLNNFQPSAVRSTLAALFAALRPGGALTYFEYMLIREIKSLATGRKERRRLRKVGRVTGGYLRRYEFQREAVFLNIPPALVHHLRKPR